MRSNYFGHYPPTPVEFDRLWTSGLIVVDANALLSLYRYTPDTRDDLLGTLQNLSERLWMPYQVGLEFNRNRVNRILGQRKAYGDVFAALESAENSLMDTLRSHEQHSSMPTAQSIHILSEALATVKDLLTEAREKHDENASPLSQVDFIWDQVSDIFDGKVGDSFSDEELSSIYKKGEVRYQSQTPPGYKDIDKPEPRRYGDLVIWMELLRRASETSSDVIFITEDLKEDWWRRIEGKKLGPRVELVEEFGRETNGRRVHFYETLRFLEFAKERGLSSVREASLGEVRRISETRNRLASLIAERDSLHAQLNELAAFHQDREPEVDVAIDRFEIRAQRLERDYNDAQAELRRLETMRDGMSSDEALSQDDRKAIVIAVERSRQAVDEAKVELDAVRHRLDELRYRRSRFPSSEAADRMLVQTMANLDRVERMIRSFEERRRS